MRALEPILSGHAVNPSDGVRIGYEAFGPQDAARTVLFSPAGSYAHSRLWKLQVPYFARHGFRVVTYDCRGSGRSDRPAAGYSPQTFTADLLAVLDELEVEKAALVGITWSIRWLGRLAAQHPERVTHLVSVSSFPARLDTEPIDSAEAERRLAPFLAEPDPADSVHWCMAHMRDRYPELALFQATEDFPEPHSSKPIEDLTGWALETCPRHLIASSVELSLHDLNDYFADIACPTLVLHGANDEAVVLAAGERVHRAIRGSRLVVFEGSGHVPVVRDPVRSNHVIHDFLGRSAPEPLGGSTLASLGRSEPESLAGKEPATRTWRRAMARTAKRALFVSSPIGLGHSQRDVAVARELRELVPGLEIDWLAQHPVTAVLEANGERIHPASALLAGESPHIESLMGAQHELNVFQAIRQMDEILLANFHVFHDVAAQGDYDLWVGDEAWEVDYYLHENPELKTAPFAWLTDFVGFLPMVGAELDGTDDGGREAYLTADYNAEMIQQVERFKRVRDASIYIGSPEDVVPDDFGPGLPRIGEWLGEHFDHNGYIRYFDPAALGERAARRARFGFGDAERVIVAAVGGTSVGASLLRRIVAAYPQVAAAVPGLRLIVVSGPRIDPASLPQVAGVEYRGYVHDLYQLLAAADAALVQGGLSTTMELVAAGTPFLYFPLTHHFEQNRHVAHRLERYGAPTWARMTYPEASPPALAERLTRLLREPPTYRPVEAGGARRAAERIAALL